TSYRYHGEIITIEKAKKLILDGEKVESPWKDNGYNWGIEKVSYFLSICQGRSMNIPGAHCLGMNNKSVGIAFVGDFDISTPTFEHYKIGGILCAMIMNWYPAITVDRIFPHNKFANKTCPGKRFDMELLKAETKKHRRGFIK
ncbi:MAG: N-acetylmuramoyl-L-alanine amidase, partial [Deltaproteobacteria bacterium]|nr:N-acetylmuramoyl-L-alanine amidase [Deltaproteobacteria bacterium]